MPETAINCWKAVLSYFTTYSSQQVTQMVLTSLRIEPSFFAHRHCTTNVSKRRSIAARSKETVVFADLGLESEVLNLMSSTI